MMRLRIMKRVAYLPEFNCENGETFKTRASVLVEEKPPTLTIYEQNNSLLHGVSSDRRTFFFDFHERRNTQKQLPRGLKMATWEHKTLFYCFPDKTQRLSLHRRLSYRERRVKIVLERPLQILTHGLSYGNGRHSPCFVYASQ